LKKNLHPSSAAAKFNNNSMLRGTLMRTHIRTRTDYCPHSHTRFGSQVLTPERATHPLLPGLRVQLHDRVLISLGRRVYGRRRNRRTRHHKAAETGNLGVICLFCLL
jgi:hypothetical protein